MSRDFILIFSGGMVSLITTVVVLFVADYIYRRSQLLVKSDAPRAAEATPAIAPAMETQTEPPHPPESKLQMQQDNST